MKFDGFPDEKTILSFKLANGLGWLTTHRLIIQQETHNPRFNIVERQKPEMYLLRDFEKAEIKGETHFSRHCLEG
jgi:predicted Ser/Thr protein kinase